ncbi:MAG: amidohydrolase family protein [Candidatus Binatia bacterium]
MHIDIHAHYIPPAVVDRLKLDSALYGVEIAEWVPDGPRLRFGAGLPPIRPILKGLRDLSDRQDRLKEGNIHRQILSTWLDIVGYVLPVDQGCKWSRLLNQCMAEELRKLNLGEVYTGTASVPLQDGARAAEELEFARKECGLNGVIIASNINGKNLDEPSLRPFWRAAEKLQVPIIIHPFNVLGPERLGSYFLTHLVGLPADTTIAAATLYFSGVIDRFPDLRVILCHGGGFFPYQAGRLNRGREIREDIQRGTRLLARDAVAWFYYDSLVFDPEVLEFLVSEAGPEHVLLGSDCPFGIGDSHPARVVEEARLTPKVKDQILSGNAIRLFGMSSGS